MKSADFLSQLAAAKLSDPGQESIAQARAVLFALPAPERDELVGMCCRFHKTLPARGAGAVTVFEVFVAIARRMAKEQNLGHSVHG
jgi:hypothetical protein